jgi:hypothetical protein
MKPALTIKKEYVVTGALGKAYQRCDGFEVVLQPRDVHAQFARQLLNAQGLVEIVTESLDCSDDGGGGWASAPCDLQSLSIERWWPTTG